MENRYFPVFIPTEGKRFLIFGGGNIAERRVKTLLEFGFELVVTAPELTDTLKHLADSGQITYIKDKYSEAYLEDAELVTACTNNREINHQIGEDAKKRGLPVSVCDNREECTFFFPAIAVNDEVTMGLTGSGTSHDITRRAAGKLREIIEGKAY